RNMAMPCASLSLAGTSSPPLSLAWNTLAPSGGAAAAVAASAITTTTTRTRDATLAFCMCLPTSIHIQSHEATLSSTLRTPGAFGSLQFLRGTSATPGHSHAPPSIRLFVLPRVLPHPDRHRPTAAAAHPSPARRPGRFASCRLGEGEANAANPAVPFSPQWEKGEPSEARVGMRGHRQVATSSVVSPTPLSPPA